MHPFIAEFVGTTILLFLGNGVVANVLLKETKGKDSGYLVITLAWALAVFVAVSITGQFSGAHLNPAVSVGLAVAGKFSWALLPFYIMAQFFGACFGAFLVWLFYFQHYQISTNEEKILATFSTGPAIRHWFFNVLSEILASFVLVFSILYFTSAEIISTKTPIGLGAIGALPVALLVLVIGLSLGGTTGYAVNPARDLGPRLMHAILPIANKGSSDWAYCWIPIVGPLIGAALAGFLFLLF